MGNAKTNRLPIEASPFTMKDCILFRSIQQIKEFRTAMNLFRWAANYSLTQCNRLLVSLHHAAIIQDNLAEIATRPLLSGA
jgi:hypothetical protein